MTPVEKNPSRVASLIERLYGQRQQAGWTGEKEKLLRGLADRLRAMMGIKTIS